MTQSATISKSNDLAALREELAYGYRVVAHAGIGHGLLAHLTARLPGAGTFWTYQFGQSVEEVRIADLRESDFEANPIEPTARINPTLRVHGAIYAARADICCIAHHHGESCVAMGAIGAVLVPFDRNAARWHGDIDIIEDYDDAHAIADQGRAMVNRLGARKALILKHHGVLVTGRSVRDTVVSTIELEKSFAVQLKAMAAGKLHVMPDGEIRDGKSFLGSDVFIDGTWNYLRRALARERCDDIA
ncbi:MAG: class II aldolase/adducin family protein [Proteobacteria bacterium]|nr:class II aldolase/adducin family protein [Pseudomonadota bacterium]